MKTPEETDVSNEIRKQIRAAGLRCTTGRFTVLRYLYEAGKPLTHAEVAEALAAHGFDRATIYRNLTELVESGMVNRINVGDHVWRFEMKASEGGKNAEHPHFVCLGCGKVSCLENVNILIKRAKTNARSFGKVTEVLLKGLCPQCT